MILDDQQPLTLSREDLMSPVWSKVRKYCEGRLVSLRALNDGDHDPYVTARIRGSIREVRNLLELESPVPAIGDNDA